MKNNWNRRTAAAASALLLFSGLALAAGGDAATDTTPQVIQPPELVKMLQEPKGEKPLILQVGFRVLYEQAHIPGSEFIGAASKEKGRQELHKRVQGLPRSRAIVLYCGCCPWSRCPNVQPAYKELQAMGFRNVKILYIAKNFGADWVDKGYPTSKEK
jgi:rhodanese-related sulfurtransferase